MTDRGAAGAGDAERGSVPARSGERGQEFGGDPACWLSRVCDACGRFVDDPLADTCPACGAPR